MKLEEIRVTLFLALDNINELYENHIQAEELLRSEREAHNWVVNKLNAEMAAKARKLVEKRARIASFEKELAESKGANLDANHKVESANQEEFCGTSKKGIDIKTDYGNLFPATINLNA